MTPADRRDWTRVVLAHSDLTAAQKVVVVALSTYADYDTGRRAFPGEERLASDTGLQVRAVRYALAQAVDLGLIERTALANPRLGRANVYALAMPVDNSTITGTAMPVIESTTGTAMPVIESTTGTAMPVKDAITGTAVHHHRHGGATITGTAVPPTIHRPSMEEGGALVEPPAAGRQRRDTPSPLSELLPSLQSAKAERAIYPLHCPDHRHIEHPPKCGGCQRVREAAEAQAAAEQVAESARRAAVGDCPDCQGTHWLTDEEGTPIDRCTHPRLRATA